MRASAFRTSLLSICFTFVSACTTSLTHEQLAAGIQPKQPGFSYYLPRVRFTVTVTYVLNSCPPGAAEGMPAPIDVSQTVSIIESPVVDDTQHFSVPLKTLTSGWKTTTMTATLYDNQTLHTLGASVDDQTAEVVKGVVGTALSIARTVTLATSVPGVAMQRSVCTPLVYAALQAVDDGQKKLLDSTLSAEQRAAWATVVTAARGPLEFSHSYAIDPTPFRSQQEVRPPSDKIRAWFTNLAVSDLETITTGVRVRGFPVTTAPLPDAWKGAGIIYREPAPVIVEAYSVTSGAERILATLNGRAGQFGAYRIIPLTNGAFENNNISLSFAGNGQLESLTYGTRSRFETIANTVSETATSVETFLAKRAADEEAARQAAAGAEFKAIQAETELLKAKADKIEQERRLRNLGGAP
jgi:hypothetical protein